MSLTFTVRSSVVPFARPAQPRDERARPLVPERPPHEVQRAAREQALLTAWRAAHWDLHEHVRDRVDGDGDEVLGELYEAARSADAALHVFYRARAEVLAAQLRDEGPRTLWSTARPSTPAFRSVAAVGREASEPLDGELSVAERVLLARFRAMDPQDRLTLLGTAAKLAPLVPERVSSSRER